VSGFLQSFNACNAAPPGFSDPADSGYVASTAMPCTPVLSNGQEGLPPGLRQTYLRNLDPRLDAQQSAENAGNRTGQVALRFDF